MKGPRGFRRRQKEEVERGKSRDPHVKYSVRAATATILRRFV